MRNTPAMIRKAMTLVVRAVVSNLTPKRVERVTSRLQWLFGPRRGMTAFMFGWCRWKSQGFRFARRPSRMMTLSMVDVFLIGTVPVHGTVFGAPPPPLLAPWVAVDAAEAGGGGQYRVGVSFRNGAFRSRTFML